MIDIFSTWYPYAFLIIIFFFVLFKKQIGNLLDRTKSITKKGLETELVEKQTLIEANKGDTRKEMYGDFILNLIIEKQFPFISKMSDEIKKSVDEMNIDIKKREDVLFKFLALLVTSREAEISYRIIFGTQIKLLQHLNSKFKLGDTIDNLQIFYDEFIELSNTDKNNFSYQVYLGWLQSRKLIVISENKVFITDEGKYFLSYILENKYPFDKGF